MNPTLDHKIRAFTKRQNKRLEGKSALATVDTLTTWTHLKSSPEYDVYGLTDEGYIKNSIASACIIMLATSAPEATLKIYRPSPSGEVEVEDHWFTQLIQQPNPVLSTYELWELTHTYLNTAGNAYWKLDRSNNSLTGPVIKITPLRPDQMIPVTDAMNQIRHYHYQVNGKPFKFLPHEILHVKFPNPLDEAEGLPPLVRVFREIGIDNAATDFTQTFFKNAAVPYGLLTTEQRLRDEEEVERIQNRWIQWFRGFRGRKRFRPAVLGNGLKYEQLALNFQEMEFESIRSMTETRICGAFGVDPVLLPSWVGIRHGGKYSNYAEARKHLWDETIIPALRRIESKITSQLLAHEGLIARFDLSQVQALQEDMNLKFERIGTAFEKGILRLDEARTEIGLQKDALYGNLYRFELGPGAKSVQRKSVDQATYRNPKKSHTPSR